MRLYINGRFLSQRLTGVQRFARETLHAMDSLAAEGRIAPIPDRAEVLVPRGTEVPTLRYFRAREVGVLQGHAWEQLELPWAARDGFLVGFGATGPLAKRNQVVTVHDAAIYAVPTAYTRAFRVWYQVAIHCLLRLTPQTVTVSEFSKRELCKYFRVASHRINVTSEGKEHILRLPSDESILLKHDLVPKGYFLAVGSMSAHKNFDIIPRALERLQDLTHPVVIVGGGDDSVFGSSQQSSHSQVKRLGYVSDAELGTLLGHALAYIHPSKYEGFGLPPLEAMALGCPVIAARAAAVPEVTGDAALYFDPDDADELASQLRRLADNPTLVMELSNAGLARSQQFSWSKVGLDYWTMIR